MLILNEEIGKTGPFNISFSQETIEKYKGKTYIFDASLNNWVYHSRMKL